MNDILKKLIPCVIKTAYWKWDNQLRVRTERELYAQLKGVVACGPFAGMRYIDICGGSGPACKYLGIYEKELRKVVASFLKNDPALIIDVGAAEGYYAVGLLRLLPRTRVIAFEADKKTRGELEQMATLNGTLDRLSIKGFCDAGELTTALNKNPAASPPPWLIVDIEGGEKELLDPVAIPALRTCPILVELHDAMVPGCHETLTQRFAASHHIQEIHSAIRTLDDVPADILIPGWKLKRIIRERGDTPMTWLWMKPKTPTESNNMAHSDIGVFSKIRTFRSSYTPA